MLEKLTEKTSLWDYLEETKKPIVIYGMGDGALKIIDVLEHRGIKVDAFFASDDFQRGHSFMGFPVQKLAQIREEYEQFIILLAFGTFREPLLSYLYELSEQYEFYSPDVPAVSDTTAVEVFDYDYLIAHESELDSAYKLLADDKSRQTFLNIINYKLSGKVKYLLSATSDLGEAFTDILKLSECENYVDLGAYNGDTIEQFLHFTAGKFSSITAFEPDEKNFKKLQKKVTELKLAKTTLLNCGSYSEKSTLLFAQKAGRNSALSTKAGKQTLVDSVDNVLSEKPASFIKLDVEGAEEQSILGARETINRCHPKILLSAYHKNSDLFLLPLLLNRLCGGYKFYLRHHPYIPAWDTNFYCVFD